MQIILASKCPVDIKYRYITGSPTRRYKTVKSLDKELTAQSVPQPRIKEETGMKFPFDQLIRCL